MIAVSTEGDLVRVQYKDDNSGTIVYSVGASLTEAIENIVIRFKELQGAALEELYKRGFIRVERSAESEPS